MVAAIAALALGRRLGAVEFHPSNVGKAFAIMKVGEGETMDHDRARTLLLAQRDEVSSLLGSTEKAAAADRITEDEEAAGDYADAAQPLTDEAMNDAIAQSLHDRLDRIERALARLDDGTYGFSVRSGKPIPDERLEADPAAELTVEEAANP